MSLSTSTLLCFCSRLCPQLFGCGSVAQTVLSRGTLGEPLTIHIGFTLGVMMAVYMAGGVSGKKSPMLHMETAHNHNNTEIFT